MATYSDPTIVQLGEKAKVQTGAVLTLVAGILALVGAGFFFGMTLLVNKQNTDTKNSIVDATAERARLDSVAKDLVAADKNAKNLHTIFDAQKQWDKILGTIEQRLYRNMAVTGLQFTEKGELSFTAYTYSFEDYARINASLTDENGKLYFSSVRPTNVTKVTLAPGVKQLPGTAPDGSISFSFTTQLTPRVLSNIDQPTLVTLQTEAGKK